MDGSKFTPSGWWKRRSPKIETSAEISRGSMISRPRYQLSRSFPISSSPGFAKVADKVARGTRTVSLSRTKSRDYRDKSVAYRFPARFFRSSPRFFSPSYALLFYSFASFFLLLLLLLLLLEIAARKPAVFIYGIDAPPFCIFIIDPLPGQGWISRVLCGPLNRHLGSSYG